MNSLEHIYECINKETLAVTILTGDFNAKSSQLNTTRRLENGAYSIILYCQTIYRNLSPKLLVFVTMARKHVLICADQPCLFTETGVRPSLDPHSKHNITIYGPLNFHIPSPPRYKRKIWDYKSAKIDQMN